MIQITLTRRTLALVVAFLVAITALATGAFVRTAQASHQFSDVGTNTFFHDEINWLVGTGIANGFGSTFKPTENIKRQQAALWFKNYNDIIVEPHWQDTDNVHGIADTSVLATDSDVSTAIAAVNSTDSIEIVTETVPANASTTGAQATPTCPDGKRPIAGGATYVTGFYTASSYPNGDFWHTEWEVLPPASGAAYPETTAYAVCAPNLPE
jgi:hypothetical protein